MIWISNITVATEQSGGKIKNIREYRGQLKLVKLSKSNLNFKFGRKRETCRDAWSCELPVAININAVLLTLLVSFSPLVAVLLFITEQQVYLFSRGLILSVWTGANNEFLLTLWSELFDEWRRKFKKVGKIFKM